MSWYNEAIFYHIYPLGLTGAPKHNDYSAPVSRLNTLLPWIDHIREIGCTALYIGPLFESVGHGYETTDYKKLDSRLGTNEDLKNFVAACHEKEIKVIFDGVFNHTGRDFFAFKDIQQNREHSRYLNWYCNVNFGGNTEYNDGFSYENWGGYNLLVKLNQRNPEVQNYICDVIRFWVSEFDVDGIRLDAADVLDFDFMRALRRTAAEVKEDFWLMGEVIHGDYSRWVNGETLHSVTNYALHKALYSGHNDHNYFEIAHTVKYLQNMGNLDLYNFVDNHDVTRVASILTNEKHLPLIYALMFGMPGIPCVYYGSEWGIQGRRGHNSDTELRPRILPPRPLAEEMQTSDGQNTGIRTDGNCQSFSSATGPNIHAGANTCCQTISSTTDSNTDTSAGTVTPLTLLIQKLAAIHAAEPALHGGRYQELLLTNRQYAFARHGDHQAILTAANNDDNAAYLQVPLPFHTTAEQATDLITGKSFLIDKNTNKIQIELEGNSAVILGITEG